MENYIVSARKYRPATFDTVVGQRALTTTLKNAIASRKLAHAYLFCGPRGVGKTTCARIFAKTINCLHPTVEGEACNECESCVAFNEQRSYNIHELDAASNNSVEDIRSLIEQVRIPPQVGKYKVYIIDEVHMLSLAAFNAFLKTLEEPPRHAIFILATTEKHKILPTILSRCQIYDFSRISVNDMVEHLENVAAKEHIEAETEALVVLAQKADGGMRDALSIFDQVASFTNGHITYRSVIENLNVLDYEYYFRLTDSILRRQVAECLLTFNEVLQKGFDGNHFITGMASHFRDLLVSRDPATLPLLEVGASIRERYKEQSQRCSSPFLFRAMKLCNDCDLNYRVSKNKRLLIELTLIQLAQLAEAGGEEGGDSPKQPLKPVFDRPASAPSSPSPQARETTVTRPVPPQVVSKTTSAVVGKAQETASFPKRGGEKKIPVVKAGSVGMSIRHPHVTQMNGNDMPVASDMPSASEDDRFYEDRIFNESELKRCWNEFAVNLPKEEAANAARMMNLVPRLQEDRVTFEVTVDNDMVLKYMQDLAPHIETHLRRQLHNRKVKMQVRVNALGENVRAYSHLERFQMMSRKNPSLLKLQKEFGLELS